MILWWSSPAVWVEGTYLLWDTLLFTLDRYLPFSIKKTNLIILEFYVRRKVRYLLFSIAKTNLIIIEFYVRRNVT